MTRTDATQGEEARVTEEQMARLKALSIDTLLDIGQRPTPPPQLVEDVHALLSSHEALLERVARAEAVVKALRDAKPRGARGGLGFDYYTTKGLQEQARAALPEEATP